jgi:hypothetical protein
VTEVLKKPLKRMRAAPTKGGQPRVDRTGGHFGAGLLTGVAVITRGEARGHYEWIDQFAVEQVATLGNKASNGVKSRFAHPGLSADGLGTMLGRMKNFRVDGDRALADLHFQKSAHNTPDGDLATYVMDMAEEDAAALATSIVFDPDWGEMDRFIAEHEDEDGYFRSPDDENTNNFEHIRVAKLWADDVVDEPAANPDGLFRKGHEIAEEADRLCEFALGLSSDRPVLKHLSVDAQRISEYAARFLDSHQLELRKKEMAKDNEQPAGAMTKQELDLTLEKFSTGLLSKVDEKLAAFKPKEVEKTDEPSADDIAKGAVDRYTKLSALAANAGIKDHEKVAKGWYDKGLSFEHAELAVQSLMVNGNQLTKDSGQTGSDPDAKYKKEYNAQLASFTQMGITLEEYTTSRKVDDGKELLAPKSAAAA